VTVRAFIEDDIDRLVEYRNIEKVWSLQDWEVPYPREKALRFLDDDTTTFTRGEWTQLAIEHNGELVGDVGFSVPDAQSTAWIGYSLHPDHWGRGIATRAVQLVIERLASVGADTIRASVDSRNRASAGLLVRCGFTPLDEKQPITVRGEEFLDDVYELVVGLGAVGTEGS